MLYLPMLNPHLQMQKMTELADQVFCFYGEWANIWEIEAKIPGAQRTPEVYS